MSGAAERFAWPMRLLHWLMALMILAMLFIGVSLMSTVSNLHRLLLEWHKPLGLAVLLLAMPRLGLRLLLRQPVPPAALPRWQQAAARWSHALLYGLMLAMPLIGWAMLSAGGYPIQMVGSVYLPPIAPHDLRLYSLLHRAHIGLALLLYALVLLHLAAALSHALIRRDGVFHSMAPWRRR